MVGVSDLSPHTCQKIIRVPLELTRHLHLTIASQGQEQENNIRIYQKSWLKAPCIATKPFRTSCMAIMFATPHCQGFSLLQTFYFYSPLAFVFNNGLWIESHHVSKQNNIALGGNYGL